MPLNLISVLVILHFYVRGKGPVAGSDHFVYLDPHLNIATLAVLLYSLPFPHHPLVLYFPFQNISQIRQNFHLFWDKIYDPCPICLAKWKISETFKSSLTCVSVEKIRKVTRTKESKTNIAVTLFLLILGKGQWDQWKMLRWRCRRGVIRTLCSACKSQTVGDDLKKERCIYFIELSYPRQEKQDQETNRPLLTCGNVYSTRERKRYS